MVNEWTTMAETLTIAQIDQMRRLLKKAMASTPEERAAKETARQSKRKADRDSYRAEVLAWAVERWHADYARLKLSCPQLYMLGVGEIPTVYTPAMSERFKRRNSNY
jgi:outer membrane murein-binding lipoprotein Lpp